MLGSEIRFPLQKREEAERFFPLFVCRCMRGLGTSDLKTPLPGAGGVCKDSRNRSRAARVRVPFSAPRQKGESLGILLFCFCMPAHGGLGTCDLKTPLPGAGGDVSKKWRGALVLRLRILLSGRADGQSIESSSSALPPPHFVFPFLPFSLPRISVPSSRCARRRAGVGPCFDSAENSFLSGGASESLRSWVPGLLLVRKFVNEDARSVVGIEVFADFVAVGVEVAAVEPFDVVLLREFDFNLFVLQLFELVAVAEELLQCDARRQIDPSQGVFG